MEINKQGPNFFLMKKIKLHINYQPYAARSLLNISDLPGGWVDSHSRPHTNKKLKIKFRKKFILFRKWFDLKSPAASFLFPLGSEEKCQELLFKYLIHDENTF